MVPAAVAIELTHLATLYHDDVMDEAAIRRGHASANSRWTNTIAILTGDFLFARASQILADLGDEAIRIQAETFSRLVSGQIAETIGPAPGQDPLAHYLRVVTEKTGSLIATAGRFGAMFSGAPAEIAARMEAACGAIGIAWQLSDDILDVASESAQSGKTPGTDLREGIRSLPVLHALRASRCTRKRSGCYVRTPRWRRPARTSGTGSRWRETRSPRCRTFPRGPHSSRSATMWWTGQADW